MYHGFITSKIIFLTSKKSRLSSIGYRRDFSSLWDRQFKLQIIEHTKYSRLQFLNLDPKAL